MSFRCRPMVVAIAALAHSCAPDPAVQQLVEEVRAARLQRRAESTSSPTVQATRDLVEATVAPVGEVLASVSKAQRELAGRQAELAAELQRWTQLVVTEAAPEDGALLASLQQRLQALEAALAAERVRQDELESTVGAVVTRLSDQLTDFLDRLEALQEHRSERPEAAVAPLVTRGEDAGDRPSNLWPLWGVAFLAIGAGVWLMLPSTSARAGKRRERAALSPTGPPEESTPRDAGPTADSQEPDVEQLWHTAAMLGEAIGKIKRADAGQVLPASTRPPAAPAAANQATAASGASAAGASSPDAADPGNRAPVSAADRGDADAEAPGPRPRPGFPSGSVSWSLRVRDAYAVQARLLQMLRRDRRVLRQPAPVVEVAGDSLNVAFAWMPETPAGERALLEQKLREAAR